jgi:hypothetical protein
MHISGEERCFFLCPDDSGITNRTMDSPNCIRETKAASECFDSKLGIAGLKKEWKRTINI